MCRLHLAIFRPMISCVFVDVAVLMHVSAQKHCSMNAISKGQLIKLFVPSAPVAVIACYMVAIMSWMNLQLTIIRLSCAYSFYYLLAKRNIMHNTRRCSTIPIYYVT